MIIKNNMKKLYIANFATGNNKISRVRFLPGLNKIDEALYSCLKNHPLFIARLNEKQIELVDNSASLNVANKKMKVAIEEHKETVPEFDKIIAENKKNSKKADNK